MFRARVARTRPPLEVVGEAILDAVPVDLSTQLYTKKGKQNCDRLTNCKVHEAVGCSGTLARAW